MRPLYFLGNERSLFSLLQTHKQYTRNNRIGWHSLVFSYYLEKEVKKEKVPDFDYKIFFIKNTVHIRQGMKIEC